MNVVEDLLGRGGADGRLALIDTGAGGSRTVRPGGAAKAAGAGDAAAISYARLAALVDETAQWLRSAGVVAGGDGVARIGIVAPNGIPHVVLALAVLRAGGCVVPVAGELAPPERRALLAALHPRAVLVADAGPDDAWEGSTGTTLDVAGATVRVVAPPGGEAAARSPLDEDALADLDPAFIRFSSGTTGASKGVILSHRTLVARVAAANRGLGIEREDRVLWLLPMAHHFAASILLYLARRATTVLVGSHLASDVLAAARRHEATVFYGAPFHYGLLAAEGSRARWPALRLAVSTAAALPAATARSFERRYGVPVVQALGIIEAGLVAVNDRARALVNPESVGHPLPDFEAELRDERGACVAPGAVGELFLRGPGMLDGYLWPFRRRAEILSGGWFCSGDLAIADADGSLRLVGRTRSVINVAGMKCFPEEIEAVLQDHPQVAAVRVAGRPHAHVGAVPVADVVPRDPSDPPATRSLAAHCRAALAAYKVPVEFRMVASLALTASGKVKR